MLPNKRSFEVGTTVTQGLEKRLVSYRPTFSYTGSLRLEPRDVEGALSSTKVDRLSRTESDRSVFAQPWE